MSHTLICPLEGIGWGGESFQITDWMTIAKQSSLNLDDFITNSPYLSHCDIQDIRACTYFLVLDSHFPLLPNADWQSSRSQYINLFQLLLWVNMPTHLKIRHCISNHASKCKVTFHDQVHPNPQDHETTMNINLDALLKLQSMLLHVIDIKSTKPRLNLALSQTFFAITSFQWSVSYIMLVCALETILCSYIAGDNEWRIRKAFGILLSSNLLQFNEVKHTYKNIFDIRNKIVHGDIDALADSDENLAHLSLLSGLVRRVWSLILTRRGLAEVLASNRAQKTTWFNLEYGRLT